MLKKKEYIGISLDGNFLKVAHIEWSKKKIVVNDLKKLKLIHPIVKQENLDQTTTEDVFGEEDEEEADLIFGLDDEDESGEEGLDEIDLDDLDEGFDIDEEQEEIDLADEAAEPTSNEMLLYEYLSSFGKSKVILGLNVPAGDVIFQLLKEAEFSEMKKKDLLDYIQNRLQSIYGDIPSEDNYDYHIREDGTLILASTDEESRMLQLVSDTATEYNQNYFIKNVVADESVMIGLYKQHYEEDDEKITGLLQIGDKKCRLIFMSGGKVLQISPIINEGVDQKNFLNTIFSKILFQLDTGEVPGLDRLIVFNNELGDELLDFFRTSFTDIQVENFLFPEEAIEISEDVEGSVHPFTTAIGVAAMSAKSDLANHIDLYFLPKYVEDQQKIFKLQWHGVVLLLLIGVSPVILNHYYQENVEQIEQLQLHYDRTVSLNNEIQPIVEEVNMLNEQLEMMQGQLGLLTELSEDNIKWTVTIDEFNQAAERVRGLWINSFRQNSDVIMVDGYALQQSRIPELADEFSTVTLLNVRKREIREQDVFFFTMMIREVIDDKSRFTPEATQEFQNLMDN